jgi:hypothetical protein
MGASGWQHFVPYQEDINAALQQIRQTVFTEGSYYKVDHSEWRGMTEQEIRQRLNDLRPEIAEVAYSDWQQIKRLSEPDTIDKLLEWNRESGTHSILDVTSVSHEPEFGTVSPLNHDQLHKHFGTLHPTREQAQAWLEKDGISSIRRGWSGFYMIIYADEKPIEICFAGYSGD